MMDKELASKLNDAAADYIIALEAIRDDVTDYDLFRAIGDMMEFLDTPFNGSTGINLRNRIAELLAQPETEQEPAAWMWEEREYKGYTGQYRTYGISREKPALDGIIENIQPLYLAPPKRDPLSCHGIGE